MYHLVSSRKGGPQQIHTGLIRIQPAFHDGNQVVHVCIGLQALVPGDPDRTGGARTADVVAQQIDDHGQFGIVLGAGGQFVAHALVLHRGAPAGARAFDGACFHVVGVSQQKAFRRGGDDLVVAGLDVGEKGRRIQFKEMSEKGKPIPFEGGLEALRQIDLIDIPGGDVIDDPSDGIFVSAPGEIGHRRPGRRAEGGITVKRCRNRFKEVPSTRFNFLRTVFGSRNGQAGDAGQTIVNHQDGWRVKQQGRQLAVVHTGARQLLQIVF